MSSGGSLGLSVNSRPTKQKLLDHVVPHVTKRWYVLGVKLLKEEQEAQLDVIKLNHTGDNQMCCMEMLWYWLSANTDASWQKLIEALQSPIVELPVVAANLEKILKAQSQQEAGASQLVHQEKDNEHIDQQSDDKSMVISKEDFKSYNDVGKAFIALQTKMKKIFKKADYGDLRRACIAQMHNPGGAELSQTLIDQISAKHNINDLFDLLVCSPYWSWLDIRVLEAMVVASDNLQAVELLDNYKAVVFSKKLIDLLPNVPSKEAKEEYYSKVVSKVKQDHNEMTVADLLKFQSQLEVVILDIKKGICILDHLKEGCIEVHWYIPTSCVDGAYQTATARCNQFKNLNLLYLKIGHYPVIHNPLASLDVVSTPFPPVNVATVKDFIDHYYDYLLVSLDSEIVMQLMVSQQLLSEDTVMAASSDYQRNYLALQRVRLMNKQTLLSFGKLLLMSDSQKHIGTMLIDGLQLCVLNFDQTELDHDDTTAEHIEQKDKEELPTNSDMIDPSLVISEFLNMKVQLEELLQQCDPISFVKKCYSLLASKAQDIPLFPTDYAEMLQEIKNIPELIQKLSPFMTWDNHFILSTVAEISNIPEATILLKQFDDRIDPSQPLTSFPVPAPSYHMVPYDNSTHTVLAVELDLELYQSTLQNVIDARSLIQDQCKLTSYCMQLLAVAKTTSTILYWMIPKSITHFITANASQFHNYYHQKGILQLAVYPGTVLCTGSALKVGPLSFFSRIEIDTKSQNSEEVDSLTAAPSQLEDLPKAMSKLWAEKKEKAITIKTPAQRDEGIHTQVPTDSCSTSSKVQQTTGHFDSTRMSQDVQSQEEQLTIQLKQGKALEASLQEKLVKEKQKYSDLLRKYEGLQEGKALEASLQEKLVKEKQKYSDLLGKYEELQSSLPLGSEVQTELTKLEVTMENVTISLEKVEVIKKYWSDKVYSY